MSQCHYRYMGGERCPFSKDDHPKMAHKMRHSYMPAFDKPEQYTITLSYDDLCCLELFQEHVNDCRYYHPSDGVIELIFKQACEQGFS
jgi:hypothetical protein